MIHNRNNITVVKKEQNNFMVEGVTATWGTVSRGCSIRRVEKHCFWVSQSPELERANIWLPTKANKYIVRIPLIYRNSWPFWTQKNPSEGEMWFDLPVFTNHVNFSPKSRGGWTMAFDSWLLSLSWALNLRLDSLPHWILNTLPAGNLSRWGLSFLSYHHIWIQM